jgi:hypothetical protein
MDYRSANKTDLRSSEHRFDKVRGKVFDKVFEKQVAGRRAYGKLRIFCEYC